LFEEGAPFFTRSLEMATAVCRQARRLHSFEPALVLVFVFLQATPLTESPNIVTLRSRRAQELVLTRERVPTRLSCVDIGFREVELFSQVVE
jgi:hypothetical protein